MQVSGKPGRPDRRKRNRVMLTYRGETRSLTEWAEARGIRFGELRRRLNVLGWSVAKALSTPDDRGRGRPPDA